MQTDDEHSKALIIDPALVTPLGFVVEISFIRVLSLNLNFSKILI